jgi:hypothetical protein
MSRYRNKVSHFAPVALACAALGVAAAAQVTSCAAPTYIVQQYSGSPRPAERIAVLRLRDSREVHLITLDRERLSPVEDGVRLHIEMLPGEHELDIIDPHNRSKGVQSVRFAAEAGKAYRVILAPTLAQGATGERVPRVYEIDPSSEDPIRVVSERVGGEAPAAPLRVAPPLPLPADAGADAAAVDARVAAHD